MDKKIAGLLGAVAALGGLNAAQATTSPAPADVLQANSFADLLTPIPNAKAKLQAVDEREPASAAENGKLAQFYHHHHHHHHHHHWRRPLVVVVPHRHHHHHHHHHHHFRRDY